MFAKNRIISLPTILLLFSLSAHADPLNNPSFADRIGETIMLFIMLLSASGCSFLYFITLPFLSGSGKINNWWTRFLSILILILFIYVHFSLAASQTDYYMAPSQLIVFYTSVFENFSLFTVLLLFAWLGFIVSTWRLIREFLKLVKEK